MIEQTKFRPEGTLEFKLNKQKQFFSFNPLINLVEEGKWLLPMSLFECTISVFNITNEIFSFSITIPGQWETKSVERIVNELNKFLEFKSENSIELHVEEVRKRGNQIKIGDNEYLNLSDLDTLKDSIFKELKRVKYRDLEDLIFRLQLTCHEIVDILDVKYFSTKRIGYSLKPNIYNVVELNITLINIQPDNVKITVTIDEKNINVI